MLTAELWVRAICQWPKRRGKLAYHYLPTRNMFLAFTPKGFTYVGYCRKWQQFGRPALAIFVAEPMRRRGHALRMLHEANRLWPDAVAYVHERNEASVELFVKALWMPEWDIEHDRWLFRKEEM